MLCLCVGVLWFVLLCVGFVMVMHGVMMRCLVWCALCVVWCCLCVCVVWFGGGVASVCVRVCVAVCVWLVFSCGGVVLW